MRTGRRSGQRGTAMVVMLIVLVTLGTIAGLTVISVQGGTTQVSAQRFSAMALYAAESGAAAAMVWIKTQHNPGIHFTPLLGETPAGLPGNGVRPGQNGNLLSEDQQGWYEVTILNNRGDPQFSSNQDSDDIVILQVTGHGPNGALKRLEWEVQLDEAAAGSMVLVGWRDVF